MAIIESKNIETARRGVGDLLTSDFDKDPRFKEAEAKFRALVAQIVPEHWRVRNAETEHLNDARRALDEAAFGMTCVAIDIIADRWHDSIIPASLRGDTEA